MISCLNSRFIVSNFALALLLGGLSCCGTLQTSLEPKATVRVDKFENIYVAAKQKVESNRFGEGKLLLEDYLRKSPNGNHVDQSQLFLGQMAFREKKYPAAESFFNKIIAKVPMSPMNGLARFYRARVWEAQGKRLEAFADLSQVNEEAGTFPSGERLKFYLFRGGLAKEFRQPLVGALSYQRAIKLSEELKNPAATNEAVTKLQSLIQSDLNANDLQTFIGQVDPRSVPGFMAQNRLAQLQGGASLPVSASGSPLSAPTASGNFSQDFSRVVAPPVDISRLPETYGEENKIGLLLPINNPDKSWGRGIYEGMQLALKKTGSKLKLVIADPGPSVDSAKLALESLVNEQKVMAIVGPLPADQAYYIARASEGYGIPFISTSPRTQLAWGATTINFSFDFAKQSEALVRFATSNLNATRFAMLFPRDDFGRGFAETFSQSVAKHNGTFTAVESYPPDQKDFRKNIENMVGLGNMADARSAEREQIVKDQEEKLKRSLTTKEKRDISLPAIVDFDVVFIADSYRAIGQVAPLFAYYDIQGITLMGPSTWNSSQTIKRAGQFLDESIFVDFFTRSSPNEVVKEFLRNFENEYGKVPSSMQALGYDLISSMDRALRGASSNRKELMQKLLGLGEFVGALGLEKWDSERDPISELQVFRIRKNTIQWQQSIRVR